jgi:hypothetical protein
MGQALSSIGVRLPGYLHFILSTIFPSLLLITQLCKLYVGASDNSTNYMPSVDYICYVVNKQRGDGKSISRFTQYDTC